MAGPVAHRLFWAFPYNGTAVASLRLAALLALALGASGCAVSGPLGSMFAKSSKAEANAYAAEDVTGSVASPPSTSTAALPSDTDLVFARMAVVDVLKRGSKEISAPWENPASGAHGTVTPIASAYDKDGGTCRDFLASYVRQGAETWLQGEACRAKAGGKAGGKPGASWEVKSLRPWSRS
jgi:surface antigen